MNIMGVKMTGTSVISTTKHDWECTAPNGYYRWHCKKCGALRPYPDPHPESAPPCHD